MHYCSIVPYETPEKYCRRMLSRFWQKSKASIIGIDFINIVFCMQQIFKVANKNKVFRKWQMLWHIYDEGLATEF